MLFNTRFIVIASLYSTCALAQSSASASDSPVETLTPLPSTRTTSLRPTSTGASSASAALPSGACLQACIVQGASRSSCDPTADASCACTDTTFQNEVLNCLNTNCPEEAADALALQQQNCAGVSSGAPRSSSFSLSLPASITRSASSALSSASASLSRSVSASGSRSLASPSSTNGSGLSPNGAPKLGIDASQGLAAVVVAVGGIVGAMMVF
ncbi:hypothetical protein AX16_010774 [Volvariella volvacea WC 439]|nr:hypothetical protein AX16_010774 [Volvariella volvacea WC 439]